MTRRTLAYVAVALALLAAGRLLSTAGKGPPAPVEAGPPSAPAASDEASAAAPPVLLRRPPRAIAELGVLTDVPAAELAGRIDRAALASSLTAARCGNAAACDAVRATLRDEQATTLQVVDASSWDLASADLDASARGFSPAERARIAKKARVVVVHVATPASPQALAVRSAFAAAAAIAEATGGVVWDQLLNRMESAHDFAAHAVTESLEESAFRSDRVALQFEPARGDGSAPGTDGSAPGADGRGGVRVLTAGLSRWGAPDVEWRDVPAPAVARVGRIVLLVARAVADGASGPDVAFSVEEVARLRAEGGAAADAPAPEQAVSVDLAPVTPENGDPNDFFARVEPPGGEGPIATIDLVERFFGSFLATAPDPSAEREQARAAQSSLGAALGKWTAARSRGAKLLVRLPFSIPGDAGVESMWVDVTGYDATSVTGKLVDDPLGATDVARGDTVTRPRGDVEAVELRGANAP